MLGSLSPLGASPELNRPMSASSLLLAWLACICTPLASANVVAGTSIVAVEAKAAEVPLPPPRSSPPPSKCLDTCVKAGDAICQDGGEGASGVWCEFGTDCTDCGPRPITDPPAPSPWRRRDHAQKVVHYTNGRAWTLADACESWLYSDGQNWREWTKGCGILWHVPGTQFTVSFPVAGTIDLAASITSLWADVRAGVRSYLQCLAPDCMVQAQLIRGGLKVFVTDFEGNGSSTAILERARALSQEREAAAFFASLPEALFKALGPVTVSAPWKAMSAHEVHYNDNGNVVLSESPQAAVLGRSG